MKDLWPLPQYRRYDTTILLQFAFNVACGAWSAIDVVSANSRRTPPVTSPASGCWNRTSTKDQEHRIPINLDSLPIHCPNNCDLRAVCGALEQMLLPQNHPAHENKHANYRYYESIGGYTEGANAIFQTHNSVHRLIKDHLSVINARLFHLTFDIASLRENPDGYISYWWDRRGAKLVCIGARGGTHPFSSDRKSP
jgi:hypothetical protein